MSGWYCAACGHRQGAAGACPRDQHALAQAVGLLGTAAGNFTLVEVVGRGGMGEVLRAINPMLGATVAVKVLHATAQGPDAARFLTEARAVNRVAHDGVVKVLDGGYLETGRPYLVMELLDGASLAQVRAARAVPADEALRVIDEVLEIVGAAHAAGIVHRDLKPANVFLARRGRTMVLDFGVAKLLDGDASITRTGSMIGTPGYMAPEQIHAGSVDARTDVYAIGVMLFELLVGRPPFDGASPFHVARAHISEPVPRLPPALARFQPVIDSALAKDPSQRFYSAALMRSALASCGSGAPAARTSKRRWWLGAGALAVVGVTIGIVAGTRRQTSTSTAVVATMQGSAAASPSVVETGPSAPTRGSAAGSAATTVASNSRAAVPPSPSVAATTPGKRTTATNPSAGGPTPPGVRTNPYLGDADSPAAPQVNAVPAPLRDKPTAIVLPAPCEQFLSLLDRVGHCDRFPPEQRNDALASARDTRKSWEDAMKQAPGSMTALASSCTRSIPALEQALTKQGCP